MFKKSARLNHSEFTEYFKIGKRHHFPDFTIITAPAPQLKVAVVVGKKVSKLAVRRNQIRRRIYATLYRSFLIKPYPGVMIIIVKPAYKQNPRVAADVIVAQSIAQVAKST